MYSWIRNSQTQQNQVRRCSLKESQPLQENELPSNEEEENETNYKYHRRRPLRKLISYVRDAWTGVKSVLESEFEDLETPPRYRPESLESLCKITRFSSEEIKRIYRGFKAECPSGIVKEDSFKMIFAHFFPPNANTHQYAHFVFNTLDPHRNGLITFEDFIKHLSVLSRGTLEEKLRWTFTLYDIDGDGCITKDEMTDIVSSIYDLMGKLVEPMIEEDTIKKKVDWVFKKMDGNMDGIVTLEEFLDYCRSDLTICSSMAVFDTSIL